MAALSLSASAGEALVLGLATGPVCLATCGPVVVPWMMVQPRGVWWHSRQLGLFLAARLAGYMVFAAAVWMVGSQIPRAWIGRTWLMGGIEVLLAVGLVVYAVGWPHRRCGAAKPPPLKLRLTIPPALKLRRGMGGRASWCRSARRPAHDARARWRWDS